MGFRPRIDDQYPPCRDARPDTQANVVTTDQSGWATNCREYKVTAVQVTPSNGPTAWQAAYRAHSDEARHILPVAAAE